MCLQYEKKSDFFPKSDWGHIGLCLHSGKRVVRISRGGDANFREKYCQDEASGAET